MVSFPSLSILSDGGVFRKAPTSLPTGRCGVFREREGVVFCTGRGREQGGMRVVTFEWF